MLRKLALDAEDRAALAGLLTSVAPSLRRRVVICAEASAGILLLAAVSGLAVRLFGLLAG